MLSACVFFHICRKLEFLIFLGSIATCLRWGGYCRIGFVATFMRFAAVQKCWKLVKIWQRYRQLKGENFLRHSVDRIWRSRSYLKVHRHRERMKKNVAKVVGATSRGLSSLKALTNGLMRPRPLHRGTSPECPIPRPQLVDRNVGPNIITPIATHRRCRLTIDAVQKTKSRRAQLQIGCVSWVTRRLRGQ